MVGMRLTADHPSPHRLHYSLKHALGVLQDIVVPEPQDPIAILPQSGGSLNVSLLPLALSMLAPIHLDYDPGFETNEVHDELVHGMLPAELRSDKLPVSQSSPEHGLRIRLTPPKLTCEVLRFLTL